MTPQPAGEESKAQVVELKDSIPSEVRVAEWGQFGSVVFLGQGEYAVTYAAADTSFPSSDQVAIKLLKPARRGDADAHVGIVRETMLLSQIDHPNIIQLLATGMFEGDPFLVLPLLPLILSSLLPRCADVVPIWVRRREVRRWPASRGIRYARQLAEALAHCHDKAFRGYRVLHRDIKPKNIGIKQDDTLVLFDFGLSCLWRIDENETAAETRNLTGCTGSLRYMAPEVALCLPYSHKAEVWSFASLLLEMLAHEKPYKDLTESAFFDALQRGSCPLDLIRPAVRRAWHPALLDVLADCFCKQCSARPEFRDIIPRLTALDVELADSEASVGPTSENGSAKAPGCHDACSLQ